MAAEPGDALLLLDEATTEFRCLGLLSMSSPDAAAATVAGLSGPAGVVFVYALFSLSPAADDNDVVSTDSCSGTLPLADSGACFEATAAVSTFATAAAS